MTSRDIDQAKTYAQALILRAEYRGEGSIVDLITILKAIEELEAMQALERKTE